MCYFHSVIVRKDGVIAHEPGNSHSAAAEKFGWRENTDGVKCFWEAEWDCRGQMPDNLVRGDDPPDIVLTVARKHYEKLCTTLATGNILCPFDLDEYCDVRIELASRDIAPAILEKLAGDANNSVRCYVARNVKAPAKALEKLAGDA
jgi:hypothetical protein